MALDEVCRKKQARCLKVPLKSTEQIYLLFLIPTLINCAVYVLHFSADLVVAEQHFEAGNSIWGWSTIALIFTPALAYFVLTVSRSDWWMSDEEKATKGMYLWFGLQVCQLIAFPLFSLYRYAGLIVLSIDALLLSGKERVKTLNAAAAPAAIELYFFLRAWFQAIPQALLQTHLFFRETYGHRSYPSQVVQILSILISVMVAAIETTSFQRFESQRVNGRKLPWAMWYNKYRCEELQSLDESVPLQPSAPRQTNDQQENTVPEQTESKESDKTADSEAANERPSDKLEPANVLNRQISVTPPLPPKNVRLTPPPAPLRGITTVTPLLVPEEQAPPRPDSIVTTFENSDVVEQKQEVSGVREERVTSNDSTAGTLRVPKRKHSTKGLEEDDPVGVFLSFLWWFFFILARVLSIAILYEFFPVHLAVVIVIHYVIMLVYLFYYTKYPDPVACAINLWLGLIYIFCVIEYRIKFKYADKWLLPYYTLVMLQNAGMTLAWFFTDWEGFWYAYVFCVIFFSMVLSIFSAAVYNVLLKPKKCRVYNTDGTEPNDHKF